VVRSIWEVEGGADAQTNSAGFLLPFRCSSSINWRPTNGLHAAAPEHTCHMKKKSGGPVSAYVGPRPRPNLPSITKIRRPCRWGHSLAPKYNTIASFEPGVPSGLNSSS